ncbi:MAG: tetratricopeptide repeat protein [Cyanobacteria bacterium SZAS-4]|nr:tetratricopeptide repeat protein [Cyanobacteria bacterium SZAS-4]
MKFAIPATTVLLSLVTLILAACTPSEKPTNVKLDPKQIAAEHATVWQEKNKSGLAAMTSGDLDKAEKDLVAGLKEAEECGPEDERVAVSLNNLASLYENKKMYSQCASYLQKARKLFRKAYGDKNELIPVTERNEARILTKQDKWAESLPLYEEAIRYMEMMKSKDLEDVKKEYAEAKSHVPAKAGAPAESKPAAPNANKPAVGKPAVKKK